MEENEDEQLNLEVKVNNVSFDLVPNANNQAVKEGCEKNDENQTDNDLGDSDNNMEGTVDSDSGGTEEAENLVPDEMGEEHDGPERESAN